MEVLNPQDLLSYLLMADEIISFNGRTYDLISLEKLLGSELVQPIWNKVHHDLKGWREQGLKNSIRVAEPHLYPIFESTFENRFAELHSSGKTDFISHHLANTYRDTKFTYELFLKYLESKDFEFTF